MSPTRRQDTGCLVKASIMFFLVFMSVVCMQLLVMQKWGGLLVTVPFTAMIAWSARWLGRAARSEGGELPTSEL